MKIAILVDSLAIGGAERQAILSVAELRKLGHGANLFYYRPSLEYGEMLSQMEIVPIFVPASSFLHRCATLARLLKRGSYEVVHGFKMAAEVYAAIAGAWAGVPRRFGSVRSVYNLGPAYRVLHFGIDKLLNGWVVNSDGAAESLSRLAGIRRRKIEVLHNGVSGAMCTSPLSQLEAKAKLGLPKDCILISMVARLEPGKNHRMLLAASKLVVQAIPEVRFAIVGKGSLDSELRQVTATERLDQNVSFLGQRSDVADILAATDIAALSTDYEGLPNAIIEAMSAGKAIACTQYAGATAIMTHGDTALLSPCGDAARFAANLITLARDGTLRHRLGENARWHAERAFSPASMARRLEAIYRRDPGELKELTPLSLRATR